MNCDSGSDVEQEVDPLIVTQVKCTRVMLCWQFLREVTQDEL